MISVDELTSMVKNKVNSIQNVNVRGEIGKVTKAASGHSYFELMSTRSKISCVVWSTSNIIPETGEAEVLIKQVDFYPPYGRCQAIISTISQLDSDAKIASQRAALIETLQKEGVLDRTRLQVPQINRHLCIISSDGSAASHDMLEGIDARWHGLKVTFIHTLVQGNQAVEHIKKAFKAANELCPPPDVIICGRGGGSETDLEVFNDEQVVRCFINTRIPIISAIGHETDHSVSDLTADIRAKTPTAAIEIAIPQKKVDLQDELQKLQSKVDTNFSHTMMVLKDRKNQLYERLVHTTRECLKRANERCSNLSHSVKYISSTKLKAGVTDVTHKHNILHNLIKDIFSQKRTQITNMNRITSYHMDRLLRQFTSQVECLSHRLNAFSHEHTLKRGFALIRQNDTIIKTADVKENSELCVVLQDGFIDVVVKRCRRK